MQIKRQLARAPPPQSDGKKANNDDMPFVSIFPDALAWWSTAVDCQLDVIEFVEDRVAKDQDAFFSALLAPGFSEMLEIHLRWIAQASTDYDSELSKFAALYSDRFPVLRPALRLPD